jgi:hypothetical protein
MKFCDKKYNFFVRKFFIPRNIFFLIEVSQWDKNRIGFDNFHCSLSSLSCSDFHRSFSIGQILISFDIFLNQLSSNVSLSLSKKNFTNLKFFVISKEIWTFRPYFLTCSYFHSMQIMRQGRKNFFLLKNLSVNPKKN